LTIEVGHVDLVHSWYIGLFFVPQYRFGQETSSPW